MNLIIDWGNTSIKIVIFKKSFIVNTIIINSIEEFEKTIEVVIKNYPLIKNAILSSVVNHADSFFEFLNKKFQVFIPLNHLTPLPLENLYQSPQTLGYDRIAAVVGANNIFPDTNVLVVDIGTAITFDFVNDKNQYLGGNISPGLNMRLQALHHFTSKLPLVKKFTQPQKTTIAQNTQNAIKAGVENGIKYEIESYINLFERDLTNFKTILTGGDVFFFEKIIKKNIFAEPKIVSMGLNRILNYNV